MSEISCAYQYTVKRGDSFYLIAQRAGLPLRVLLAANPGIPPSRLTVGDVLCIPALGEDGMEGGDEPEGRAGLPMETAEGREAEGQQEGTGPENAAEEGRGEGGEKEGVQEPEGKDEEDTGSMDKTPEQGLKIEETPIPIGFCPPNRRAVVQEGQTASDLQLRYDLSYYTLQRANEDMDLENLQGGDVVCVPLSNLPCRVPGIVMLKENESLESLAVTYNLPIAVLLRLNPCLAPEDFAAGAMVRLTE